MVLGFSSTLSALCFSLSYLNIMIDISISQLVNEVDKSQFTLYAEWENTYFRVILLRHCTMPLSGEMHVENANYFLDNLEESFETYLQKTRDAFSGKNTGMQFFLHDDIFKWTQQNILTRGEISVYPLSNILTMSDTLKQLAEIYQRCQEGLLNLEKKNEVLSNSNAKLITELNDIIHKKNAMEKDLYAKFLVLLNTKKRKLRELQETLDNNKPKTKLVYDESTDEESEKSDMEDKSKPITNTKSATRNSDVGYKSQFKFVQNSTTDNFKKTNFFVSKDVNPEPSTSKVILQGADMFQEMKSTTVLQEKNTTGEESEEDIFDT